MDAYWTLVTLVVASIKPSYPWELQLCSAGTWLKITQENCSRGVWFEKPWDLEMLCGSGGMWAVYQAEKSRPKLWTTYPKSSGCASKTLIKKVNGVLYLGESEGGAAVWTEDEGNVTLLTTQFMEKTLKKYHHVYGGSVESLSVVVWGNKHYRVSQREMAAPWAVAGFQAGYRFNCLLKGNGSFAAEFQVPVTKWKRVSVQIEEDECKMEDKRRNTWLNDNILQRIRGMEVETLSESPDASKEFVCPPLKRALHSSNAYKRNIREGIYDRESVPGEMAPGGLKALSSLETRKKIDEQSERVGRKFIGHVFNGDPIPEARMNGWELLMVGKDVFALACPDDIVPESFFETMLVFLQLLLAESVSKFPPKYDSNQRGVDQIYDYLKVCYNNATPMEFIGHSSCVEEVRYRSRKVNFEVEGVSEIDSVDLPAEMKSDVQRYDSILESVWKLVLFVHYYCAKFFSNKPHLLSALYEKWQGLMTPDILLRWQYQGKSNLMVTTVVRNLNVRRVLRHVDECLAGAHLHSPYTAWLHRPFPVQKVTNGNRGRYRWSDNTESELRKRNGNYYYRLVEEVTEDEPFRDDSYRCL